MPRYGSGFNDHDGSDLYGWDPQQHGQKGIGQIAILVATLIVSCYCFYRGGVFRDTKHNNTPDRARIATTKPATIVSCCKNPNCVRCRRYRYVQERARRKLAWILWDSKTRDPKAFAALRKRIPEAIARAAAGTARPAIGNDNNNDNDNENQNGGGSRKPENSDNQNSTLQNPTVLMVPDLPSREIVTDWHRNACDYLKEHQTRSIVGEALQSLGDTKSCSIGGIGGGATGSEHRTPSSVLASSGPSNNNNDNDNNSNNNSNWTVNDSSPDGDWRVFQILNQGVWNPVLLSKPYNSEGDDHSIRDNEATTNACSKLLDLVRNIPGLLDHCLFGNVFVSKIYPGTDIEPHCGPTNVRHRLQFLLKLPESVSSSDNKDGSLVVDQKNTYTNDVRTLSLSVGNERKISWDTQHDVFVFDDSFVHSVAYHRAKEKTRDRFTNTDSEKQEKEIFRNKDALARVVLVVDLWHPGLQNAEMSLLQQLYPPFTTFKT